MPIKIMEPIGYPGNPPKSIGKKNISVIQNIRKKCFEILRFKISAGGISVIIPQTDNGTHISSHSKRVNFDSFYQSHKFLIKLKSPCLCIRIGYKINEEDLNKVIPRLLKFLPDLNSNESSIKNQLLKNRFILFHVND